MKKHERRYSLAWALYQETTDEKCKMFLEREMDAAQERFTFDEFQDFKKTLPCYTHYWNSISTFMLEQAKKLRDL